jgi:hypothetical protein
MEEKNQHQQSISQSKNPFNALVELLKKVRPNVESLSFHAISCMLGKQGFSQDEIRNGAEQISINESYLKQFLVSILYLDSIFIVLDQKMNREPTNRSRFKG